MAKARDQDLERGADEPRRHPPAAQGPFHRTDEGEDEDAFDPVAVEEVVGG